MYIMYIILLLTLALQHEFYACIEADGADSPNNFLIFSLKMATAASVKFANLSKRVKNVLVVLVQKP